MHNTVQYFCTVLSYIYVVCIFVFLRLHLLIFYLLCMYMYLNYIYIISYFILYFIRNICVCISGVCDKINLGLLNYLSIYLSIYESLCTSFRLSCSGRPLHDARFCRSEGACLRAIVCEQACDVVRGGARRNGVTSPIARNTRQRVDWRTAATDQKQLLV